MFLSCFKEEGFLFEFPFVNQRKIRQLDYRFMF